MPVLTGLGHEIDQSVADLVAHRAFKTPTKVAEFLVARLAEAELAVARARERLLVAARAPLAEGRGRLLDAERRAGAAWRRLERLAARLEALADRARRAAGEALRVRAARAAELAARLVRSTPRALGRFERLRTVAAWRLLGAARTRLAGAAARLEGSGRLLAGLSLERTLARGFSVTRTAAGKVVRAAAEVRAGERLVTQVAAGRIASRVEEA